MIFVQDGFSLKTNILLLYHQSAKKIGALIKVSLREINLLTIKILINER